MLLEKPWDNLIVKRDGVTTVLYLHSVTALRRNRCVDILSPFNIMNRFQVLLEDSNLVKTLIAHSEGNHRN